MSQRKIFDDLVYGVFRKLFSVKENNSRELDKPEKIIVIRQHNQLGDLLAGISVLRALKETYPNCHITLVASPSNYPGVIKNKFIDRLFIFDKKQLIKPEYFNNFVKLFKEKYDLAVVPVTVSISFTSNLLARFANAKVRIGPAGLDGKLNKSMFLFDRRVAVDWRKHPDSNVAERILDIVRPFGINTSNYSSEITFDEEDLTEAESFIKEIKHGGNKLLIGLHVGAGKIPNRWSLKKYIELMEKLSAEYPVVFYLTGSSADNDEIEFIRKNITFKVGLFIDKKIPEVAALISRSDLFISNDTGIMHVAGTTGVPQISIFGPTNPFNWAPIGHNKFFLRKSELIDEITVDDVFSLCKNILSVKKEEHLV